MVASPKGGRPYEIPDWRKFKVEDSPELLRTQERLAAKGLKDPWLRNEVWRYVPSQGTTLGRFWFFFSRGMAYGLVAAAATIAFTEITGLKPPHGHHEHENHEEMSE